MTFDFELVKGSRLETEVEAEILSLCNEAYSEDVSHLLAAYTADIHVLALADKTLVGHGMIVTRRLQAGEGPLLRTSYVELVATAESFRNQGIGAAMLQGLAIYATDGEYYLSALCPADTDLYRHLGWEYWQGPPFFRPVSNREQKETPALIPTPEERVMIWRFPNTPPLDLEHSLSAEWRGGGELW